MRDVSVAGNRWLGLPGLRGGAEATFAAGAAETDTDVDVGSAGAAFKTGLACHGAG
ncbi:hypothetical protein [Mycobacterium riyadhense]|uniref:hypothetical protein n=1 Tax=Mycobacterium riyadhense TaxID=486698 RepID=UPI00146F9A8D|nr:hypothetical protein [Mycobacterium riyadhense]MCV7146892.1 hypothetical protein [Mycobacterium riyadhense]